MTTPPLVLRRVRIESGTFRACSVSARAELWEKMTGASVTSRASLMVPGETCDRSTSIPSRFISRTTSRPNSVSPPWRAEGVLQHMPSLHAQQGGDAATLELALDVVGREGQRQSVRIPGDEPAGQ